MIQRLGAALVKYKSKLAGAVERILHNKLAERVSVLDFGADPTGVNDSSDAFQKAVDAAYRIIIPAGIYRIDKAIVAKHSIIIEGEGNPGYINRAMSFINMNGNFPFLTNWQVVGNPNSMIQVHAKRLFIQYNPTTRPELYEGNSSKIAFHFLSTTPEANGLEFSSFEDIVVLGAWAAYWDSTGTYMTTLKRVEARQCRSGFLKATGTTITLENCYAKGCVSPYQFGAMSTVKMTGIALDESTISLVAGSQGGAGIHLTGVRSFSIDIIDAEVNRISTDGSGFASLIHIEDSVGSISGLTGLHNDLVTEGAASTSSVALIRASNNSLVKIEDSEAEFNRDQRLDYSGSGIALTVLTDATSRVYVDNSRMKAPGKKAGSTGTPQLMALSQGNVTWGINCDIDGLVIGGTKLSASGGAIIGDAFVSNRGSVVVAANTPATLFTLPTEGVYEFAVYASGSGKEYMATGHVIYDGTNAAEIAKVKSGAFLALASSTNNVTVQASGSTTLKWSYTKIS